MKAIQQLCFALVGVAFLTSCATDQTKRISKEDAAATIAAWVNKQLTGRTYIPKLYDSEDNVPRPYPRNEKQWRP